MFWFGSVAAGIGGLAVAISAVCVPFVTPALRFCVTYFVGGILNRQF